MQSSFVVHTNVLRNQSGTKNIEKHKLFPTFAASTIVTLLFSKLPENTIRKPRN